jgi:tetratricopeptide (TPR) repeat protein
MEMKTTRYSIRDTRCSTRITHKGSGNYAAAPETPESRIHLYILIFCLTFVPLNLLVSLTNIASANTATQIQQPLPAEGMTAVQDSNSPRMQQMMRAQLRVIDANETPQSKQSGSRLKQIIEQVRSVQFGSEQQPAAAPPAAPAKGAVTEPARSASEAPARREDPNEEIKFAPSHQQVTGETLKMLKDLLPHPEKLDRPLEMGEVLFSSGNLTDAAVFYQEALKRADPNDANASGDRAWILFQIGNCLRNSDRSTASKMYGQLLSEYPQSPWTYMAQAEGKLIEWYLKDNPHTLISADKTQRPKTQ